MKQLELFPENQITVALYFTDLRTSINLNVVGPGLEIDSYWTLKVHIVSCFPSLAKSVAKLDLNGAKRITIKLSEEEWKYWSVLGHWPHETYFYWGVTF